MRSPIGFVVAISSTLCLCLSLGSDMTASASSTPSTITLINLPQPGADTLTLLDDTYLYDNLFQKVGVIAPQTVKIIDSKQVHWGHGEGYLTTMYLIPTWLGERWIVTERGLLGNPKPLVTKVDLSSIEPLYNDPQLLKPTGGQLAPQIVTTVAKWGGNYLIETSSGNKWIRPRTPFLEGVREVQEGVTLSQLTPLVKFPGGFGTGATLTPQTTQVNEVWRNYHRIDSWLGPAWFKLYEGDAADAHQNLIVNYGYRFKDDKDPNLTHLEATVQLGMQTAQESKQAQAAIPAEFKVNFYDAQGQRVATSRTMKVELMNDKIEKIQLLVDGNLENWWGYSTVQIGSMSGMKMDIHPSAAMKIMDPKQSKLRIGDLHVDLDGEYSVIHGQFALAQVGANQVTGRLRFFDANGQLLGTVPLKLTTDLASQGNDSLQAFECVISGNVKTYAEVQLEVDAITPL